MLASELKLPLYQIDLSAVVSKYIGETEKNLGALFAAAEESSTIVLFDGADALFGKQTGVPDAHDRYPNLEVNYLLQRLENYDGLVILTTNSGSNLDRAFLRRLHFVVDFPMPAIPGSSEVAGVLHWVKRTHHRPDLLIVVSVGEYLNKLLGPESATQAGSKRPHVAQR